MRTLERVFLLTVVCGGMIYAQSIGDKRLRQFPPGTTNMYGQRANGAGPRARAENAFSDTARLEWVKHLTSNSASGMDVATDVAIDANACIYVTGKSESPDAGHNYLTIKYNAIGREVWRAQYDGPAHADDVPTALAIDASGNTYVTGMSMGIDQTSH